MSEVPEEDFWNELPDEVKQAIEKAKDEMDGGEGRPNEEVMAQMRERFLKTDF